MLVDGLELDGARTAQLVKSILGYGFALDTGMEVNDIESLQPVLDQIRERMESKGLSPEGVCDVVAAVLTTGYVANTKRAESVEELVDRYAEFSTSMRKIGLFEKEPLAPVAAMLAAAQIVNTEREETVPEVLMITENYAKLLQEHVVNPEDVAPSILAGGYIVLTHDSEEEEIQTQYILREAKAMLQRMCDEPTRAALAAALTVTEFSTYQPSGDLPQMLRLYRNYARQIVDREEDTRYGLLAAILSTLVLLGMREGENPVSKLDVLVAYDRFKSVLSLLND